jgi:hypothetical protein
LAFIFYLLVAEETLENQTMGSSSPQHTSNPASPRIQLSSTQAEAPTSPGIQPPPSQVEIPVLPGMDPSSRQPEASNLPRTLLASPQLETPALPGTPQASPQLIIQELPLDPEKIPSPIQETRNEVSTSIQFCYSHSRNHPQFSKFLFSGLGCISTKLFFHCG